MFTVEPPFNLQNDRVYASVDSKKRYIDSSRLLRMSIMVSVENVVPCFFGTQWF